jgi:hypothetical protein
MLHQTFVLHPVECADHLVHCIVSSTQHVNALFFMLGWNRFGFHKKTRRDMLCHLHPVRIPEKAR